MRNKIKVIHYIPGFKFGGIESRMIDIFNNIDKEKYQFDFLILTSLKNPLIDEIKLGGGNVHTIPPFNIKSVFQHIKQMKSIFDKNNYDIAHCHSIATGFIFLLFAKKASIKGRVLHARTSSFAGTSMIFIRKIMKRLTIRYANLYLAVSNTAGYWSFNDKEFMVIPNSIELGKFSYNIDTRKIVRAKYNLKNEFVVGHVGRNTYAKNHQFIFNVFSEILRSKPNAILMLVGIEPDNNQIIEYVNLYNIEKNVILCGYHTDISEFYCAMDTFIFPSLYEGLPGSLIEAQASGLKCFISDTITDEVILTNNVEVLSLQNSAKYWSDKIIKADYESRRSYSDDIEKKGYSVEEATNRFSEIYDKLTKSSKDSK